MSRSSIRFAVTVLTLVLAALAYNLIDLRPKLLRGLPKNYVQAEVEFNRRLSSQFSVGSFSAALAAELLRQGFSKAERMSEGQYSTYREAGLVCSLRAEIRWKTNDDAGQIAEISGQYFARCL